MIFTVIFWAVAVFAVYDFSKLGFSLAASKSRKDMQDAVSACFLIPLHHSKMSIVFWTVAMVAGSFMKFDEIQLLMTSCAVSTLFKLGFIYGDFLKKVANKSASFAKNLIS